LFGASDLVLEPRNPLADLHWRPQEGIEAGHRALANADSPFNRLIGLYGIAFGLVELGRVDEARRYVAEGVALVPARTASQMHRSTLFQNPAHTERFVEALIRAGLPTG